VGSVIDGNTQPLIAVDFDQTLCDSRYPKCGDPIPGGKEALELFRSLGYLILIYSCRTCHWHYNIFGGNRDIPTLEREHVIAMRDWLIEHGYPFDEIDSGDKGKPLADYYIDDKGVRFDKNWLEIMKFVEERTKLE
jgi:hypothetical protein